MLKTVARLLTAALLLLGSNTSASEAADVATKYTVVDGDRLSGIAKRFCGDPQLYRQLVEDNKGDHPEWVANPNLIHAGQVVMVRCGLEGLAKARPEQSQLADAGVIRFVGVPPAETVAQATTKVAARRSATRKRRTYATSAPKSEYPSLDDYRVQAIAAKFPERPAVAVSVFFKESDLVIDNVGYNCDYWNKEKGKWEILACQKKDRWKARAGRDCGIAQVHAPEVTKCPAKLLTLEANLAEARRKYDEAVARGKDGFHPWSVYKKRTHLRLVDRYRGLETSRTATIKVYTGNVLAAGYIP